MIGAQLANYRITDKLGEGGMGVVYKGIDVFLERAVAIKVLNPDLARNAELLERFKQEARAQANLNHTNIATLFAFVVEGDQAWMVMEFVEGETFQGMIARRGLLPSEQAVPLFRQALLGIGHAHRMGIVHRDIKPSNLMLNKAGIVKVMDFGIAKLMGRTGMTRTGAIMGTVFYMSPEQIMGRAVDIRSDIYALGVTLYEMLTANVPFQHDTDFQIQYDHLNTPPPPPDKFYPYIPKGVQNAVLKALEKNPDLRFQTVEEFGAALEHPLDFSYAPAAVFTPALATPPPLGGTVLGTTTPPGLSTPPPLPNTPPPFTTPPPYAMPPGAAAEAAAGRTIVDGAAAAAAAPALARETPVRQPFWKTNPGRIGLGGAAAVLVTIALAIGLHKPAPPPIPTPVPVSPHQEAAQNDANKEEHVISPGENPGQPGTAATASDVKIVSFASNLPRVTAGQKARLTWSVEGASTVVITPDIGKVPASGSIDVPVRKSTQYKLVAQNDQGKTVQETTTIEVAAAEGPAPAMRPLNIEFQANPASIRAGEKATLRWSVPNATLVFIDGQGRVPAQGSLQVNPAQTTTYQIRAEGPNGARAANSVTLQVMPAADLKPQIAFDATPTSITAGTEATLRWSLTNTHSASIDPEPGALRQASGQVRVAPRNTTTYQLTARSQAGTVSTASVTIQVQAPEAPPPSRQVQQQPQQPQTAAVTVNVVHDHAGVAGNAYQWPRCWGTLQVAGGHLRFIILGTNDGRADGFDVAAGEVGEMKVNRMPLRGQSAFHIRVGGANLNFVPVGTNAAFAVNALGRAIGR